MNLRVRKDQTSGPPGAGGFFVVYGMPRTGTTYLYHALSKHPGIFVSYRKESMFFTVNYDKGFGWYRSLFEEQTPDELGADINPMYFMDDDSLDRLLSYAPDVKVILGVRHPVDFAISLYSNIVAHGHKPPDALSTLRGFDWPLTPEHGLPLCLDNRYLSRRIQELCERLGSNLLIYDFRYFGHSPLPVLKAIESFLGLPAYFDEENVETAKINASGRKNILGFNRLVTNQRLLETVYRILPNGLIRRLRTGLERLSVARMDKAPESRPSVVSNEERRALEAYLEDDTAFYDRLFAGRPILRGSDASAELSRSTANKAPSAQASA
jgi:hypothetical protein